MVFRRVVHQPEKRAVMQPAAVHKGKNVAAVRELPVVCLESYALLPEFQHGAALIRKLYLVEPERTPA